MRKNIVFVTCSLLLFAAVVQVNLPIVFAEEGGWYAQTDALASDSPVTVHLFDVFMLAFNDGWIVGDDGTILHWDGTDWSIVPSPTSEDLRGIYMLSSSGGWAVGLNGVTIQWDGTSWTEVSSGTTNNLLDVAATSSNYYAVGGTGTSATMIKWDGTNWVPETIPAITAGLRSIEMYLQTITMQYYGWAVGGVTPGIILAYTELAGWFEQTCPTTSQLNDISIINEGNAWAVGAGWTIIKYATPDWTIVPSPISDYGWLSTVDMVDSNDGWAMGYNGTILHWDGTDWTEVSSPTTNTLNSVSMVHANDGWAVGFDGTIIRYVPPQWIPEFPTAILMPFLLVLTLGVAIILTKTASKKRNPQLPSETQL